MKYFKTIIYMLALLLSNMVSAQTVYTADEINNLGDFESFSTFSTTFLPFTTVDGDGEEESQLNGLEWTNGDIPKAFMIFNPQQTSPAMETYWMKARSGEKLLMAANNRNVPSDNWVITPKVQLHGGHPSVTFYANTYHAQMLEQFEVYVSNTNNNIASFEKVSPGEYIEAPYMADSPNPPLYRKMSFDLTKFSNQQVYIAIHHITFGGILFAVDDFSIDDGDQGVYSPIADFSANKTSIAQNLSITFTDESLNNPTQWNWQFMGGSPATSTEQSPTITYNNYGKYLVKLTATNNDGSDTKTKYQYIEVLPHEQLSCDFESDLQDFDTGGEVQFTDLSTGAPTSWQWVFEGGTPGTSNKQNPTVNYNSAGTFGVTLTVSNSVDSETETKQAYIIVTKAAAPVADFKSLIKEIPKGGTVQFSDMTLNRPTSWQWTFTGAQTTNSTVQNPLVTYNNVGLFDVSLNAQNNLGSDSETKSSYISVIDASNGYCSASNGTEGISIQNVSIAEINNNSEGATFSGYEDFSSQTAFLDLDRTYTMEVDVKNSHWEPISLGVWIDWNQDKDFDDAGETVHSMNGTQVYAASITPPSNAKSGLTLMRVRTQYSKAPVPCGTDTYLGEVEDYSIMVTDIKNNDIVPPSAPTNLQAINTTENSIDISWQASTDNVGISRYYVLVDDAASDISLATNYSISNLQSATTYKIAIKAVDEAGNISLESNVINASTTGFVDNEAPSIPTGLISENITMDGFTLKWNVSTDNVAVTGYKVFQDNVYLTTVQGTSTSITGLTENTTYNYSVLAFDETGNESQKSTELSVTTLSGSCNYCASKGNSVTYEWIASVQIGSFTNHSDAQNYSDFSQLNLNLFSGTDMGISLAPGFSSSSYPEYWSVWIDLNKDCDFEDAGELLFSGNGSASVSGTITIPDLQNVTTRMRISMKYNASSTSCETFNYGEVEDYTVTFVEPVADTEAPTVPQHILASNISQTSADLSWDESTDNIGVTGYGVFQNGNKVADVTTTSATITNLTANTSYSFRIRAYDAAGNESGLSTSLIVTTLEQNSNPEYCDVTHTSPLSYFYIENVTIGDINNTTQLGNSTTCYSDYTNLSTSVQHDNSYNLSLNWTPSWADNGAKVYVDWNQDGDFTDNNELVMNVLGENIPYSQNITVPTMAKTGTTTMRVRLTWNTDLTPCDNFYYGETEDYSIYVSPAGSIFQDANFAYKIYPNPSSGYINIESKTETFARVEFIDLRGAIVKKTSINKLLNTIETDDLPNGLFYLRISSKKHVKYFKIIKE